MTLKGWLYAYVSAIHVLIGAVLVWQRHVLGWWLFPLEIALMISVAAGVRWIRIGFKPNEIAETLVDVIESGELGTRYPAVGQREIDRIISTYNRMLENLQREWLRLGEQRGFLERFLAVTPIGIVILDFDGVVSLLNTRARELFAASKDDGLTGRSLGEIESPLADALSTLAMDETRMITDTNGRRLRCQRGQFLDRGFDRSYFLLEELTAELNRSERETYEKLIRMISHEVTNTVAATNSLLESCRNYSTELACDEHRSDYENALEVVITRNQSLNEFTKGFSDLVKLPEPQREEVDVRNLLQAMQKVFSAEVAVRNITLRISADTDLPPLWMDRHQMDQVLINVIKNAVEAIERDGTIEISARRQEERVVLLVSDTGSGLDEQAKQNLFKPFFTTKSHGQGLGLTLVREILTQHCFPFALEPGERGARFRIEIPFASTAASRFNEGDLVA